MLQERSVAETVFHIHEAATHAWLVKIQHAQQNHVRKPFTVNTMIVC